MNNEQLHRDLGRLESEVKALRRDVTEMKGNLATACAYIERQKGAKRATILISTGVSSVVAFGAGILAQVLLK